MHAASWDVAFCFGPRSKRFAGVFQVQHINLVTVRDVIDNLRPSSQYDSLDGVGIPRCIRSQLLAASMCIYTQGFYPLLPFYTHHPSKLFQRSHT